MKINSLNELVQKYKEHIRDVGLSDEIYKWELLSRFRGRPNLDAHDFTAEITSIDYSNLIFHTPGRVIRFIAERQPDQYRNAFRVLFDEQIPLRERIPRFQSEVLRIYRGVETNTEFGTFHDERTIATFLTVRDPLKYTFYKNSYYRAFCRLLEIEPKKTGEKYVHYLELIDEFISTYLVNDGELLELVDSILPTEGFRDDNRKILAQDILYQCLDKNAVDPPVVSTTPRYWVYAPGENGNRWDEFYTDDIAALGWDELGDLSEFEKKKEIADRLREIYGGDSSRSNDALANFEFLKVMRIGDIIIPKRGRSTYLGYGVVESDYFYDEERADYKSVRRVNWKRKGEWHEDGGPIVLKTLTDITKYPDYVEKLKRLIGIEEGSASDYNYWVFQANPKKYDLAHDLREGIPINEWTVAAHKDKIAVGDKIILWTTGPNAGCYALAEVTKAPFVRDDPEFGEYAVGINVTHNVVDRPILWDTVRNIKGLGDLKVGNQGTNFTATQEQFEILKDLMEKVIAVTPVAARNSILYGPPGTGKTFNTIDQAVLIVDGRAASDHAENKKRFDTLRAEGRIEFVTFHQNYAYEDFMVGIRPDVDNEQLRFQPQKGIFYQIAKRARENYEESTAGKGKRRTFDEVFAKLIEPLERGEEVPVVMASGISYRITEVSDKSISYTKRSGGKDHTLSISTLRDVVDGVRDVPGGLGSYYLPLVKLISDQRETDERAEPVKNFVLIIDEINRANISRVFGELITLLEEDKRLGSDNELRITLPNGERDFGVPPNLYIIGTMNTADKSIALVDIALRRRFEFIGYYPRPEVLEEEATRELLKSINSKIYAKKASPDYLIGHAYFMSGASTESVLKKKVIPLLNEYFSGKPTIVKEIFSDTSWNVSFNDESFEWDVSQT